VVPIGQPGGRLPGFALASIALVAAGACGGAGSPTSPPPPSPAAVAPTPAPSPRVALLSVDGLRADAVAKTELPNLRALAARGAYTYSARSVTPSETLPAHASMLSGEEPRVHRFTWDWNDYKPEKGFITVPTVFSVAKGAGLRTVMVVGKRKLQHLAPPDAVDTFVLAERGDADVANEAIVQAGTGFALLFVHFPDVDIAGHCEGWMSAAYLETLARLDDAVGRLLAALPPETTVILTADHGGKGRTHGRDIPEDTTVPWIVAGPKVARRGAMKAKVVQTDTAATALWMLGLRLPAGCAGAVVQEPFAAPPD
jgi:predicted AlkP superfamily pyrophosphatase or phosphodiesterase